MWAETSREAVLQPGVVLEQDEVGHLLSRRIEATGRIDRALDELEEWLRSIGYFDHLKEPNEYLEFPRAPETGVASRLQINYARLGYKPPQVGGERRLACPLCFENIGSSGKEKLRVAEFSLAGAPYFAHPTPFPLHPGHFVVNARQHEPMRIEPRSLREAAAFLHGAPGWLVASNSDVEWAGASVLGHHHIQVFRSLDLPVERASPLRARQSDSLRLEYLCWYSPVARIAGSSDAVLERADELIERWKATDPGCATCNYLLRVTPSEAQSAPSDAEPRLTLHLFFRHPNFRTPEDWRHIKSEGVGIIEMAGEIIVPPVPDRDRAGNREWFREHGPDIVRAIISGNAPRDRRLTDDYYIRDLLGF